MSHPPFSIDTSDEVLEKMSITDEKVLNENLEIAYRLLSACLYPPSAEWGEANLFGHLKGALQALAPSVAARADAMEESLATLGETELAVAHARLFVGPFSLEAPPYGSFYLEPEKKVMGETTVAVRQYYREAGLVLDEEFTELPDHMAVELEFLSYLLQRAIEAAMQGDDKSVATWTERRAGFLRCFLLGWHGAFCAAIRGQTDTPFYPAWADCLEAVIARDRELLGLT